MSSDFRDKMVLEKSLNGKKWTLQLTCQKIPHYVVIWSLLAESVENATECMLWFSQKSTAHCIDKAKFSKDSELNKRNVKASCCLKIVATSLNAWSSVIFYREQIVLTSLQFQSCREKLEW